MSTASDPSNVAARKIALDTGSTATSYTDTGYAGTWTKYYWRVWAYAADGAKSVYSELLANGFNFTNTA